MLDIPYVELTHWYAKFDVSNLHRRLPREEPMATTHLSPGLLRLRRLDANLRARRRLRNPAELAATTKEILLCDSQD